jgi:hypothetical protein
MRLRKEINQSGAFNGAKSQYMGFFAPRLRITFVIRGPFRGLRI